MYGKQQGGRHVGVMIPKGQLNQERSNLPEFTITSVLELQFKGIQYVDRNGVVAQMLAVVDAQGNVYQAEGGEKWLSDLRPLSEKMQKNLQGYEAAQGVSDDDLPLHDSVDVVASELAQGSV